MTTVLCYVLTSNDIVETKSRMVERVGREVRTWKMRNVHKIPVGNC
jgi:hypothetical protein